MEFWLRWTRFLGIRAGEHKRFAWLFAHSLFNGICIAFLFSSAYALFLHHYDVEQLPWAYIATALVGYGVVAVFSRLERVLPFKKLLLYQLYFVLVFIMTFWAAARLGSASWPIFLMFISMAPLLALLELEYWGIAFRLFDLRQGKRLFSSVGTGGVLSSIIGFFLVPILVKAGLIVHFEDLLLFAAVGVGLSVVTVREIGRRFHAELEIQSAEDEKPDSGSFSKLVRDRYFVLLSVLLVIFILTLFLVDLSFLSEVEVQYPDGAALAAFMGWFYGFVKLLELVVKAFLSGRLVSQFGVRFGLTSLPVALVAVVGFAVLAHRLGVAGELFFLVVAVTKLIWLVMRKAVFDGAFKVLYQPLRASEKFAFQARLEGAVSPAVTLGIGVLLLVNSGGGFDAVALLSVALPLLFVWIGTVSLLHREYRKRLLSALDRETGKGRLESPVDTVRRRLFAASPTDLDYVANVLEKVDAASLPQALIDVVAEGRPELRQPVLRRIERTRDFDALAAVELCIGDEDPVVRASAARTMQSLKDVVSLSGGSQRISALIQSGRPEDRELAALALGWSAVHSSEDLTGLLWDRDPAVRRTALLAAGRLRDPRFFSRILSHLSSPRFASAAMTALASIGDPVLPELEAAFGKIGQDVEVRSRILDVYDRIGSPRAFELVVDKLRFPDKEVRHRVLASLSRRRYKPASAAVPELKNEIEEVVGTMAWNLAAILDLGEDPATLAVREALESENANNRSSLFRLLSLLFDSRAMALVREQLAVGHHESLVYALEILDVVVSPDVKPMLFPVVEELPPIKAARRLEPFFPRQRMDRLDRLEAIACREYEDMSSWTRACALEAIAVLPSERVPDVLAANIFHPEPMLQEVAAGGILRAGPAEYARYLGKLPPEHRERVDRVIAPGHPEAGSWHRRSLFGRCEALRAVKAFATLPWEALMKMAGDAEEIATATGESFPPADHPEGTLYVVVEGRLGFYLDAGGITAVGPGSLVAFAGVTPSRVLESGRVFRLHGDRLYELTAVHVELLPAILDAASPPAAQEVVSLSRSFETAMSFVPSH